MMLRVKNCESGYGKLRVLKSVSLHVGAGEIVTIIGANGAGKTTLLNTIAGVIKARGGDIRFADATITARPPHEIVARGCALVPEGRLTFAPMTVEDNLVLGAYTQLRKGNSKSVAKEMDRVLALFPVLKERQRQFAGTLSGGEQQMLAIARALMSAPKLLMLDEPSMGLAPLVVKQIFETIAVLRDNGVTILLVEQNSKAALCVADRGYVMETGAIVLEGSAQELLNNNDVQRAYLGKEYRTIDER
jgi:branched-chain amino acid transport system ATP-binding protein